MSCSNIPEEATANQAEEQTLMPRKRRAKDICVKCRTERGQIVRLSITYCKKCFYNATYLRLAKNINLAINSNSNPSASRSSNLPKTPTPGRPPMQKGDLLLALSAGAGSLAMLDLLIQNRFVGDPESKETMPGAEGTKFIKRFTWRHCWVVHVDFSDVLDRVHDRTQMLKEQIEAYGSPYITFVPLKIQDVYDDRIPGRLAEMRREDTWSTAGLGVRAAKIGHAGLRVDLGRADIPIVENTGPASASGSTSTTPLETLMALMSTLPSSSHPHLHQTLLQTLLQTTAYNLPNISHLLLGDTSTRQAVSIISGTSVGRGWNLGSELALSGYLPDPSSTSAAEAGSIMRIKPMRDIMVKEAAYHCHTRGIETYNYRGWDTYEGAAGAARKVAGEARGKGGVRSLEKLTEDFVFNLDVDHPSTVSTITRTGSKLVFKGYNGLEMDSKKKKEWGICPFCGCPEEPSALEWKARTALTSLGQANKALVASAEGPSKQAEKADEAVKRTMHQGHEETTINSDERTEVTSLAEQMCYACLTAFSNGTSGLRRKGDDPDGERFEVELPYWVTRRVQGEVSGEVIATGEMKRDDMKAVVGEFLLDEDEDEDE